MNKHGKQLLSALLTIAMVLSLFVIPAAADASTPGTVGYTWTFKSSESDGVNFGSSYDGTIEMTYKELTLGEKAGYHSGLYCLVNNGGTVTIPVKEAANVKIRMEYGAYGSVSDGTTTKQLWGSNANDDLIFPCAQACDLTLTSTGSTYIRSITLEPYSVTPTMTLSATAAVVQAGVTGADQFAITAKLENAGDTPVITATSADTGIADAEVSGTTITVKAVAEGTTTVEVALSGTTLKETVNVTVRAADYVRTVWDFANDPDLLGAAKIEKAQGTMGTIAPLEVDATSGKLAPNVAGYAQFNTNTIIKVPVNGKNGQKATVEVTMFSAGQTVDVGGKEICASAKTETATEVPITDGYITITSKTNGYIVKIDVKEITGEATPEPDVPTPGADEVEAGTINFISLAGSSTTTENWTPDGKPTDANQDRGPVPATKGLTVSSGAMLQTASTSHGLTAKADGETVTLKLAAPAVITVVECQYGADSITGVTAAGTAVTLPEKWAMASGSDKEMVFENVAKGDFVLTLRAGAFLHSVKVDYDTAKAPQMQLSASTVALKMGATETGSVTAMTRFTTGEVQAVSKDTSVAEVAVNGKTITVTAKQKGVTDVEVTVAGTTLKETVAVIVKSEGESFAKNVEYSWNNSSNKDGYVALEKEAVNGLLDGLTFTDFEAQANGHGIYYKDNATVQINLENKADIVIKGCMYTAGQAMKAACYALDDAGMTTPLGTTKEQGNVPVDSDSTGKIITIKDVPAGKVVLKFTGGANYLHALGVSYKKEIETGTRNVQIWDFAGQTETGDVDNHITAQGYVDKHNALVEERKQLFQGSDVGKYANCFAQGPSTFGDLTMYHEGGDRLYAKTDNAALNTLIGKFKDPGSYAKAFADGYTSKGAWYCNGAGSDAKRYISLANVQAGDTIVLYADGADSFTISGPGEQAETFKVAPAGIYTVVAEETGGYKIVPTGGKPVYYRVKLIPGIGVSGTLDFTTATGFDQATEYGLKFTNQTTKQVTFATVDRTAKTYKAVLAPGYEYNAMLTSAPGFGISSATKVAAPALGDLKTGKTHDMDVTVRTVYTYTGSLTGFAQGYDTSKVAVTLTPDETSGSDVAELTINKTDLTFTALLDPDVEYVPSISGVNDYEIDTPKVIVHEGDATENITVKLKPTQAVSGKFLGLDQGASVTKLEFKNVDDDYTYAATVSGDGYTANLRDGSYATVATVDGHTTKTHVVVAGKSVEKDILFKSTAAKPAVNKAKDVYVGYPAKSPNYETMTEAMDAISRMGIASEADRVTVHIAPGTYREQIAVTTPYVTFINDEPAKGEVLLTWYYGIGYVYYSASEKGFYDPELAHDKFEKRIAERWGTTVRVTGKSFRAENITFENSFNRYITDEEIADGVEPGGASKKNFTRNYAADVQSRDAIERATAICVEANECEFKNCKFFSSQDTLYTQGSCYFKNCLIEGQTDYIFGDVASKGIFDGCELRWKGYSTGSQGGYVTALRTNAGDVGYLFRNCSVTANPELAVTTGDWGRPWGADANVFFLNTKLQKADLISDRGWTEMSGAKPENAQFGEFGTTVMDGTAVDTSKRVAGTVKTQAQAEAINDMTKYFGSWVPYYYVEEAATVAFEKAPYITNNGDLNKPYPGNTLTVNYSLGEANDQNDASKIQWYAVKGGTETLLKTTTATVEKTYKIQPTDVGAQIKVVVTPTTISGKTGQAADVTVEAPVNEGYQDPDSTMDPSLGDGVNIFLAGDSTVKDYSANGMWNGGKATNAGSWGEFLQNYFGEGVTVVNYANGGRSTRNFINEGTLDKIAKNLKEGDYLFIQFGHNDCADGAQYIDDRYVPVGTPNANGIYPVTPGTKGADGKYTWDCGGTYKWFLQQYIDVAKDAGATPVLITPVARMYYNADGSIKTHHDDSKSKDNAYCKAVRQLADEQKVLLIDGYALTEKMFVDAYKAAGDNTYGRQVMDTKDGGVDATHSNKLGGMIEAALFAQAIKDMDLNISTAVQAPVMAQGVTLDGKNVFTVDGKGQFTAYDMLKDYAETADYWMGVGQQLFDALKDETPTTPADKTALNAAITKAENAIKNIYVVEDDTAVTDVNRGTKFITKSDKAAYDKALADAKAVAAKADATEAEVKAAVDALNAAAKLIQTGTKSTGSGSGATSGRPSGDRVPASTTTVTNPDGSTATIKQSTNGDKTITVKDENGEALAEIDLPATIPAPRTKFVDVPDDHWAAKSINNMAGLGMVKGVKEDTYDMVSPMTRGAIATIFFRLSNGQAGKSTGFADVAEDAWYADAIGWAAGAKLINGYNETAFGPEDTITRQQLAVMIARFMRMTGMDTTADQAALAAFGDGAATDDWAVDAMAWCVKNGVVKGKGGDVLDPTAAVSRAEAAAMLDRAIGLLK